MDRAYLQRLYWRLAGVVMLVMLTVLTATSAVTRHAFEQQLLPELASKAVTVGISARTLLLRAIDYGFDYRQLYGVDVAFDELRRDNPDLAYIGASDANGRLLFESGERALGAESHFAGADRLAQATEPVLLSSQYLVSVPLVAGERRLGTIHLGIDQAYIQGIMYELLLDVVVVLIVALFLTFELLQYMVGSGLERQFGSLVASVERLRVGDYSQPADGVVADGLPTGSVDAAMTRLAARFHELSAQVEVLHQRATTGAASVAARLGHWRERHRLGETTRHGGGEAALERIRAPLFVFLLAEELTRSFVPAYANHLLVPIPGLSSQVAVGLPIMVFMLVVALGQPYLGPWSERVGRRQAMLVGGGLGVLGFIATALAVSLYDLLLWRSISAVGYGMVFVAAQGYVLDHTNEHNRTRGFALFVGAFMVATVCGPAIGGILADNIGHRWTFVVAATIAGLSLLVIWHLPRQQVASRRTSRLAMGDLVTLVTNRRFMVLTGLAAMPAKIVLTAFCFYLIPLYVLSIGSSQSMAGRMLMIYAVMMVILVPLAARLADLHIRRDRLVAVGLCISALGGLLMPFAGGVWSLVALVALLGFGQALSIAAQGALVGDFCHREIQQVGEGAVYGTYRLLERTGNALGPLIASILLLFLDFPQTFAVISAGILLAGIAFALVGGALRAKTVTEPL
jgi:MFS family permease